MTTFSYGTDYKIALAQHAKTGDWYITRYTSLWRGNEIVGTRITDVLGPVTIEDLNLAPEDLADIGCVLDAVEKTDWEWGASDPDDADWLQAEEDAGRVFYPFGVR